MLAGACGEQQAKPGRKPRPLLPAARPGEVIGLDMPAFIALCGDRIRRIAPLIFYL